jgi:hypothetical protein
VSLTRLPDDQPRLRVVFLIGFVIWFWVFLLSILFA